MSFASYIAVIFISTMIGFSVGINLEATPKSKRRK